MSKIYRNHFSMATLACYYCGKRTTGKDHYPPISARQFYPQIKPMVIRACNECNTRLSNSMQDTFEARVIVARMLKETGKHLARTTQEGFWKKRLGF